MSVRIPRGLGSLGSQDLRLVVYAGDTVPTDLIYSEDFPILYAEDFFRDSLQGFTTYLFDEVISLEKASTYYVGWEQLRASRNIGIGFDRNNAPQDVQWFNTGNGWRRLTGTTTGAIMIRPLLAGFSGFATDTDEPAFTEDLIEVYPNPTNGILHLRPRPGYALQTLNARLFAANGALIFQTRGQSTLDLSVLPAGFYLLEVSDGSVRSRHKIIRR
ncbi:MAG: T9SS type A sorting domain-containing protein [Bacteroidota bacterium]